MWIKNLKIRNLRSIKAASLALSKGVNVLIGPNNAGKSTILLPLLSLQDGLPTLIPPDRRLGENSSRVDLDVAEPDSTLFRPNFGSLEALFVEYVPEENAFLLRGNKDGDGAVVNFNKLAKREPNNFIYPFVSKRKVGALHERVTDETVEAVPSSFENLNAKIDRLSIPVFSQHMSSTLEPVTRYWVSKFSPPIPPKENGLSARFET